jgi:quinol monooxygenase YgiN
MAGQRTPEGASAPAADSPSRDAKFVIHLKIRVTDAKLPGFLGFLREAVPFYEAPGGIKIRLLRNMDDPNALIEVVEYADHGTYLRDQERVASDPQMQAYLERWREFLSGPPEVIVYQDIGEESPTGG